MSYFKGPAEYAIYAGPPGGPILRLSGATTIEDAETIIWDDHKKHPDWTYSIWKAGSWTEVPRP